MLVHNWHEALKRAWSARLTALALLSCKTLAHLR